MQYLLTDEEFHARLTPEEMGKREDAYRERVAKEAILLIRKVQKVTSMCHTAVDLPSLQPALENFVQSIGISMVRMQEIFEETEKL